MSTPVSDTLTEILFSRTRCAVLSALYRDEANSYYLRQLASIAGTGLGAVQREVKKLFKAGLIIKSERGNCTYYRANSASPIFNEIKNLFAKTVRVTKPEEMAQEHHDPASGSGAGSNEAYDGLEREQLVILDSIGETLGKRRLGATATRSQLIFSAIRNFIDDCREEEDLRGAIDEARMRLTSRER